MLGVIKKIFLWRLPTPFDKDIRFLLRFRENVVKYSKGGSDSLRMEINQALPFVSGLFHSVGVGTVVIHTSPPAFGQVRTSIDFLDNFFNLHSYDMSERYILDFLDRVIGIYERCQKVFYRNLLNPIEWIKQLIRLPFKILSFAGFNGVSLEQSIFGKLWKLVAAILTFVSGLWALIQLLEHFGVKLIGTDAFFR
ncbi:hypothetical protein COU79_02040 [Candidatus Peregrinibacteria bacterium CG10_big_fil_rev_8_21_14_0_10_54_7]|nr:MAG: hypothetical protein COU79_02040 [Candidatus Peregrinibacteria bacterium CG10_big_fil_rev_8_21_14_0_10_54_7]